eukprot:TRINITY_DN20930_c0_g1_i6.p1 TRINITY_DN20930_c0_g1~~TRINITY_DN20930_c0_g1_i6.p1  ORF type:complete len:247 (-),score=33.10 TRINITY_DN20930_c0_g1_i6:385-1125(-)
MKNVDIHVVTSNLKFIYFPGKANLKSAVVSRRRIRRLRWWLGVIFRRKHRRTLPLDLKVEYDGAVWLFTVSERGELAGSPRLGRCDRIWLRTRIPELRMALNRKRPWAAEAYRMLFGKIFYGDREQFTNAEVFRLEALRTEGERALHCRDVAGLEEVILTHCKLRSFDGETVSFHGSDAIELIEKFSLPPSVGGRIISARFLFHFSGGTAVKVRVSLGNRAEFPLEVGEIIEQWFRERGFLHGHGK